MNIRPHLLGSIFGSLSALVVAEAVSRSLYAADPVVSVAAVRAMQARLPDCERCDASKTTGAFARVNDAVEVAQAISGAARTPLEAAEAVTYAAFESANRKDIVSTDGLDHGAWQLRTTNPNALVPIFAIRLWMSAADASRAFCSANPPEERLSALVSGSCTAGGPLARRRDRIAHAILTASTP